MDRRSFGLVVILVSASAAAEPNDFRIYQLGNPQCLQQAPDGSCMVGAARYNANANTNFRAFARLMGAAMTSSNLTTPGTLGHSGFAVSADESLLFLSEAGRNALPTEAAAKSPLLIHSLHVRKGLPWSLELGVRGGWLQNSRMGIATVELKWALNEGFAYLPDIGVRGHVSKLINSRDFDLTAGGIDLGIGKRFALAGMITLTPYLGWNLVFVGASSNTVDFNPGRTLTDSESLKSSATDYWAFEPVSAASNANNRFYGGFRFIGGHAMLGFELSYTILGSIPDAANKSVGLPSLLAVNFNVGLDY